MKMKIVYNLYTYNNSYMSNYRNHKKDLRRALRTMKIQQQRASISKILNKSLSKNSSKQFNYRTASIDPKSQQLKNKPINNRYGQNKSIQNQNPFVSKKKSFVNMSVQMKDRQFLKMNSRSFQKEKPHRNSTQIVRNRFSTYLTKAPRKNSQNMQRLKTYEIYRPENTRTLTQVINRTNQKIFTNNQSQQKLMEQAEHLFSSSKFKESNLLLQKIIHENSSNCKALYLLGMTNLGLKHYLIALSYLNRLIDIDAEYNKSAYVIACICYINLQKYEQALQKINGCLSHFPDYYDAHLQKSKIYLKTNNLQQCMLSLRKGIKLNPQHYEGNMILAEAYQKTNNINEAYKIYLRVSNRIEIRKEHPEIFWYMANCQKQLKRYRQQINSLNSFLKYQSNKIKSQVQAQVSYQLALAYYNIGDYSNALMNAQQVFIQKHIKYSTQALILMTIVHIFTRNYYEAYHTILRKQHLGVDQNRIKIYQKFCEGVINLMKRKLQLGLQQLISLQGILSQFSSDPFAQIIIEIYPMYLSYGYFCVGQASKSKQQIQIALKIQSERIKIYKKSLQFNLKLCQGLLEYEKQKYEDASKFFKQSIQIYDHKPQGYLYLAGTMLKIYLNNRSNISSQEDRNLASQIQRILSECLSNLKQLNNNYAASAFYFKACFSAHTDQWNQAVSEIDQAIQRSQDNDPQSFYVRGLILACCQNYKQAISDTSISISINDKKAEYYLLRSKCFQIEGDGNRAFLDLQTYIGLSPEDTEIHKYAGHLLFQNGAFQDAIQAYDNGAISKTPQNYTVFLTRSKTFFLLGDFQNCLKDLKIAEQLTPNDVLLAFDIKVIQMLQIFFTAITEQQQQKLKKIELSPETKALLKEKLQYFSNYQHDQGKLSYGKIFRKIQLTIIKAMFGVYFGNLREAIRLFKESKKLREIAALEEEDYEEQEKDKYYFMTQMNYNMALCHLILGEEDHALKCLNSCRVQEQSKTYIKLQQLKKCIMAEQTESSSSINIQVFNQKNKMSKGLNNWNIKLQSNYIIKIKLCIPFPKVQPPEISPRFQIKILEQINILKIQRKPQAPWILREDNSIKFTEKIQKYSQLDLNNSQLSKMEDKKDKLGHHKDQSYGDESYCQSQNFDGQSMKDLKVKLKLDENIEQKLNKLLKKKVSKVNIGAL